MVELLISFGVDQIDRTDKILDLLKHDKNVIEYNHVPSVKPYDESLGEMEDYTIVFKDNWSVYYFGTIQGDTKRFNPFL